MSRRGHISSLFSGVGKQVHLTDRAAVLVSVALFFPLLPMLPIAPVADPYLMASMPLGNRAARVVWGIAHLLLVRFSPRPFHAWRAAVLRLFGASLGQHCHIYPTAHIWAPWNLICEDAVGIADGAVIYNPAPMRLGSHCVVSQGAFLCGATHDLDDPAFPMISLPMTIGRYAWICARAVVGPGANVGEGAVLGLASVATRDLEAWTVYAGAPARALRKRHRQ